MVRVQSAQRKRSSTRVTGEWRKVEKDTSAQAKSRIYIYFWVAVLLSIRLKE
jgi:hypothetical protein